MAEITSRKRRMWMLPVSSGAIGRSSRYMLSFGYSLQPPLDSDITFLNNITLLNGGDVSQLGIILSMTLDYIMNPTLGRDVKPDYTFRTISRVGERLPFTPSTRKSMFPAVESVTAGNVRTKIFVDGRSGIFDAQRLPSS